MKLTAKETKALETAKHNAAVAWSKACLEANVPSNASFVAFDFSKPMAQASNAAAAELLKVRNRVVKNAARRARNQAMRDLGLTRVVGNLGGVYWE
jgi:hypothetical protein